MELYFFLSRTMLIERLLGVAVYAGLLVLMYLIVRSAKNYKTLHRTLNVYVFFLCVMAFFYIPSETADLYRWRQTFDIYRWANQSFLEFFNSNLIGSATPVANLYMYFCNLTGIDGVLPAFCALVFYGNAFYILKDLYRRHSISAKSISETLLMFMSAGCFVEVISGIRCMVALSILARCFYVEFCDGKPSMKCLFWELVAALTHAMAVVIFVGRLVWWLWQKNQERRVRLWNLFVLTVSATVVLTYGMDYISFAANKAIGYMSDSGSYSYSWEYLMRAAAVIQIILILKNMSKKSESKEIRELRKFNITCLFIDVLFVFNYSIFHRLNSLLLILMMPVAATAMEQSKNRRLTTVISLISLVILCLACVRGNLSGYKFFLMFA